MRPDWGGKDEGGQEVGGSGGDRPLRHCERGGLRLPRLAPSALTDEIGYDYVDWGLPYPDYVYERALMDACEFLANLVKECERCPALTECDCEQTCARHLADHYIKHAEEAKWTP